MFYFFCLRILSLLAKLFYRIRYYGTEHIPKNGKLIVCSNHKSVIDPLFVAIPFRRQIRYMAKTELFRDHGRLASRVLYALGAFPVNRDRGDTKSIKTAVQILNEGGIVGIFPQGKCVFDNSPFQPKAGVALLAFKTGAPVLPVSIYCDGRIKLFSRVAIRFGKVIPYDSLRLKDGSSSALREAANRIAWDINSMLEEKY